MHSIMKSDDQERNTGLEGAAYRELRLLEEVEGDPEASQRHLAIRLGIALGVANLLVRSLAKNGYIRATQVGWKRWIYALTPAGFARKAHLAYAYIERFRDHYRRVRDLVRDDLGTMTMVQDSRIAIYGATDLAELMFLALRDMGLTRIDIFDRDGSEPRFLGMPVNSLQSIVPAQYAKIMVAFTDGIENRCQELMANGIAPGQIVTLLQNSNHRTTPAYERKE